MDPRFASGHFQIDPQHMQLAWHLATNLIRTSQYSQTSFPPPVASAKICPPRGPADRLWKTKICQKFEMTGKCPYNGKCHYAHGAHELRQLEKPVNYKTRPCRYLARTGYCPYGSKCDYIHDMTSLPEMAPSVWNRASQFANQHTDFFSQNQVVQQQQVAPCCGGSCCGGGCGRGVDAFSSPSMQSLSILSPSPDSIWTQSSSCTSRRSSWDTSSDYYYATRTNNYSSFNPWGEAHVSGLPIGNWDRVPK